MRFEIVGQLWGTLEMTEPLPVRNIGRGGALLEARLPLKADSLHTMRLVFRSQESEIQGRVRHVTTIPGATEGERYLIGFEFLGMQQSTQEQIDQLVSASGGRLQGPRET